LLSVGRNIWRGAEAEKNGMDRVTGRLCRMLATIINALALQDALEKIGVLPALKTPIDVYQSRRPVHPAPAAISHLEQRHRRYFCPPAQEPLS